MTTFYPNQPTPSFLKKYAKNAYNRVQHDAHYNGNSNDEAAIDLQPYRSTPLILPGAKVHHQRNLPTESYLRHHPNPQMRGPPTHDFNDIMMKQKVADSVLQRFGGEETATNGPKLVHKQFNSPIGLYSDNLIESTIKNTVSPAHSVASANSVPIFVDMSFLEQKKRILERQAEIERQKQQHKTYYGSSYSQKPQFNRPPSTAPPQQQQFSSYPPAVYPNSRYSFNQ
jgi:hypothetical protein